MIERRIEARKVEAKRIDKEVKVEPNAAEPLEIILPNSQRHPEKSSLNSL